MATALVQAVNAHALTATIASTGGGNTVFAVLISNDGGSAATVTSVKFGTNASNWASQIFQDDYANSQVTVSIWMCTNCPSGQTNVTFAGTNLAQPYLEVYEVSGLGSAPTLDVKKLGPIKAGTIGFTSGTTLTSSGTNDFVIGAIGTGPYSSGDTLTGPGGSWTNATQLNWSGGSSMVGYEIATSASTFVYSGNTTDYDYYIAYVVAFQFGGGPSAFGSAFMERMNINGSAHVGTGNTGSATMRRLNINASGSQIISIFPSQILDIDVSLLLGGVWTDITQYVFQRDPIVIARGRSDETQQINASQLTMTLNNQNGNFSPKNTASPFFPYIGRNVQFRVRIVAQSTLGQIYSGYRFWGEISEWPPQWDPTGSDLYVQVTGGGVLRRYTQGGNLGSALRRFYVNKTDATAPVSYWPGEDNTGATSFYNPIVPGENMTWTGTPTLASDAGIFGSDPLPLIANSVWTGTAQGYNNSGPAVFDVPGTWSWTCPGTITSLTSQECWGPGGGGSNGRAGSNQQQGGNSGGGGEYAKDTGTAVTPGNTYTFTVPAGGPGGPLDQHNFKPGMDGAGPMIFTADSVQTVAGPGTGGQQTQPGFCRQESLSATHHPGGGGAFGAANGGGAGGGSSAGTSGSGNTGNNGTGTNGGAGGNAPTGGAAGGHGGARGQNDAGNTTGGSPGAGGGGGGWDNATGAGHSGTAGGNAQLKLSYGTTTTPPNSVVRWIMNVPPVSATPTGAIILRAKFGSGSVDHMECYYGALGRIGFRGFNNVGGTLFDTGYNSFGVNGVGPVMMSMEARVSGTSVVYTIENILAGASAVAHTFSSTLTSSTIGSITTVTVDVNGNINDISLGHIVVQYALEPLTVPSAVIGGHNGELACDRFQRLCAEEGFTSLTQGTGYWDFRDGGTDNWVSTTVGPNNATVAPNSAWSTGPESNYSLLVTCSATSGSQFGGSSPDNIAQCQNGTPVSAYADVLCGPTGLTIGFYIDFFTSTFTYISSIGTAGSALAANSTETLSQVSINPPATAAWCRASVVCASLVIGNSFSVSNVRIFSGSQMGPQQNVTFLDLLQEIEDADQGQVIEPRDFYGLKFRARLSMDNQNPANTLDYSQADLAQGLAPGDDDQLTRNQVTVSRINGSSVILQLASGALSFQAPPNGVGPYPYTLSTNLYADSQLTNVCTWVLARGTVDEYRYPIIPIDMTRAATANNFTASANMDIGDYLQIVNPPVWLPSYNIDQLCWGFQESLNAYQWTIGVNCVPESVFEGAMVIW